MSTPNFKARLAYTKATDNKETTNNINLEVVARNTVQGQSEKGSTLCSVMFWDPCSRPCCVKPLPTTAIKVPASSKELLLPD